MNKIIIAGVVVIAVGGLSFYGGTKYGSSSAGNRSAAVGRQFGQGDGAGQRRGGAAGGFIGGEVLGKDATSITLKLMDGGSRIVLLSASTSIEKAASGSLDDIAVGKSVLVRGSQNDDGSMTAQSIQLQRAGMRLQGSPSAR